MSYFDGPQPLGMPPMNPDVYAQKYATENGISLDDAKNQLRAKFGDPQKPNSGFAPNLPNIPNDTLRNTPLFQFSGPQANFNCNPLGGIGANPKEIEAYIKQGAERTGMSEQQFAQTLGLPPRQQGDKTQMLKDLGIPQDIINKGDDAIRKYAQAHNIDLPAKEQRE